MKPFIIVFMCTAIVSAHSGDRLFPIYELTDAMVEKIDIHDGLIDEWYEIGEPSMTLLDFDVLGGFEQPDPSDLDFRIWLAWHDESNRIYAAFFMIDDEYKNTHDWSAPGLGNRILLNDSICLLIDADHSGGKGSRNETPIAEYPIIFGQTQMYDVISQTVSGPAIGTEGPTIENQPWHFLPPYADSGGEVAGENPVTWVIEMYVTPQDAWGSSLEETLFSDLLPRQIIGFAPVIHDADPSENPDDFTQWKPRLIEDPGVGEYLTRGEADMLVDGLLLPALGTAVEFITWGKIKASLE